MKKHNHDNKPTSEMLRRTLTRIIGPYAMSHNARERLTKGEPVYVTLHWLDPARKYGITIKDGIATLEVEGVKAAIPFIPYDQVDENYVNAMAFDGDAFCLPDENVTQAYFQRFEKAGY